MSTPDRSSPRFDAGNLDDSAPVGVKESPPEQVMVRSDVPDPYRIPSTVFESRSPTPMNWSVASNESLFSIHVGNSSFSRDHVFLGRSGDLSNLPGSPFDSYPSTPPVVDPEAKTEVGFEKETKNVNAGTDVTSAASDVHVDKETEDVNAGTDVSSAASDVHVDKEKPSGGSVRHSTSTSRRSDASTRSFAFPIFAEGSDSMKDEPENQCRDQAKSEDQNKAPEQASDAQATKWFPFCPCSFCP